MNGFVIAFARVNLDEQAREIYWERVVRAYPEFFRRARQRLESDAAAEEAVGIALRALKRALPGRRATVLFDASGRPSMYWATQVMEGAIAEVARR